MVRKHLSERPVRGVAEDPVGGTRCEGFKDSGVCKDCKGRRVATATHQCHDVRLCAPEGRRDGRRIVHGNRDAPDHHGWIEC